MFRARIVFSVVIILMVASFLFSLIHSGAARKVSAASSAKIRVFEHVSFLGANLDIQQSTRVLPSIPDSANPDDVFDWNDKISSIIVIKGTWRLYEHSNFNLDECGNAVPGWVYVVSGSDNAPGGIAYPCPPSAGFKNDEISSIELVSEENLPDWVIVTPRKVDPKFLIQETTK